MPPPDIVEHDPMDAPVDNADVNDSDSRVDEKDEKQKLVTPPEDDSPKAVGILELWKYSSFLERILIAFAIVCSAVTGAVAPLSVLFLGNILNAVGQSLSSGGTVSVTKEAHHLILVFVYLGIGTLAAAYIGHFLWQLTGENQANRIRKLYLTGILRQDIGWFDQASQGSLTTRLAADTNLVADGIGHKVGDVFMVLGQFVSGFIIAFVKGWKLAIVTLAAIPCIFICAGLISIYTDKTSNTIHDLYALAGATAEQAFGGIRTVHAFNLQGRFYDKYTSNLRKAKRIELKNAIFDGFGSGGSMMTLYCVFALAFWYGSRLVIKGEMEGSDVLVVFFSLMLGAFDLGELPPSFSAISSARLAAARIYDTIDRYPTIDALSESVGEKPSGCDGRVEFRDVTFAYPTRKGMPILNGLSLEVKPGTTVAFIGSSGCGKSTGLALIQRWYDVDYGAILLDGKDIRSINVRWLRSQIGLVGQEPAMFNLSVRDNIMLGLEPEVAAQITDQQLHDVCRMANCHDFIMLLPDGYDTLMGEHGGMLSGGQKQRIAIARALIKNPKILLLDEATSALDTTSERLVMENLSNAAAGRTIIVVAHRLSTIRNADVIVFFDKGQISEMGTHDELVARRGAYYTALQAQKLVGADGGPSTPPTPAILEGKGEKESHRVEVSALTTLGEKFDLNEKMEEAGGQVVEVRQTDEMLTARVKTPLATVLNMIRKDWAQIVLGVAGGLVVGGINPVFGFIFSRVIIILVTESGNEISPGPLSGANFYSFLHVVLALVAFVAGTCMSLALARVASRAKFFFRTKMFRAALAQEIGYFDEKGHSTGSLTARLATEPNAVGELVTETFSGLAQLVGTMITGITILFVFSWEFTLFNLTLVPMLIIGQFYESQMKHGTNDDIIFKAAGESAEIVTEAVKEIRTVTSLGRQQYFIDSYKKVVRKPHRMAQKQALFGAVGYSFAQAYRHFCNALGFYVGARLLDSHRISFENMFGVLMVLTLTGSEIGRSSALASQFSSFRQTASRMLALMDREPEVDVSKPGIEPPRLEGEFEFKNVRFHYPTRPHLDIFRGGFNLKGRKNQTVALVGPSGCGKSTVIGMLERWYDRAGGTVSIDGVPVDQFHVPSLRKQLALVGQEPVLFDLTIRENLLWGTDYEVTEADLDEACKRANAYNFIQSLTDKYDTRVGDKGSQLSGGQKQRIAIARALIRRPRILLLDEATSALDSESEAIVQAALDEAATTQTTVTIAHRLSTIQRADVIAVVKDGRVVEQGTHSELINRGGLYSELASQQTA